MKTLLTIFKPRHLAMILALDPTPAQALAPALAPALTLELALELAVALMIQGKKKAASLSSTKLTTLDTENGARLDACLLEEKLSAHTILREEL